MFCNKGSWRGRECYRLGNGLLELVVLTGGGHIAELRFASSSQRPLLNPLWVPRWKTIEPSLNSDLMDNFTKHGDVQRGRTQRDLLRAGTDLD